MATAFKLPDLGEGLTEGEVARWFVAEGSEIAEDDPLVEIQTDKATVEIPSPYAGTVLEILVAEGEVAPVGAELVLIGAPGEERTERDGTSDSLLQAAAEPQEWLEPASDTLSQGRVQATPLVRRIALELGVELATLTGTGPGGRITEDDVARRGWGRRRPREARAAPGRAPADRRAHGPRAPRGAAGDLGRGVRLRGRRLDGSSRAS